MALKNSLPNSWQIKKLREIVSFENGCWGSENTEKGVPILRSTNFNNDGSISFDNIAKRNLDQKDLRNKYLKEGDILLERSGGGPKQPVGRVVYFPRSEEKFYFGNFITRLRVQDVAFPKFLFYILYFYHQQGITDKLQNQTTGIRNLRFKEYLQLQIPLPPWSVQHRIVEKIEELFEKSDKVKKLREGAIEETENLIPSALNQIFSRAEKEGWDYVELKDITYINRETRDPTKEIPNEEFKYIDITSVEQQTGRIKNIQSMIGRNAPSRARRTVHKDDIIMSTVRPYLKAFAIIPENYNNQICSTGFAVLRCKEELIPKYLLHMLFSDYTIEQCNNMMLGAHYPALNNNQVSKIKIPLSSVAEQNRIVKYLDSLQYQVNRLKQLQSETQKELDNLKKSILDKAFKGEL